MPGSSEERERLLAAFCEQFWEDDAAGQLHSLRHYLDLFPGDAEGVAEEFLALRRLDAGGSGSTDGDTAAGAASRRSPLAAGADVIGPYRLERELGRGGQSVVWLATDTRLRRRVALKVLRGMGPGAQTQLQRLRREAALASKLAHPGICTVYEAGIEDGVPFIAMQYVEGRTLAELIATASGSAPADSRLVTIDGAEGPDTESRTREPAGSATSRSPSSVKREVRSLLTLFEKIARALHVAHEAGIVHRDIKPGNLIVREDGEPVILDFGLARSDDAEHQTLTQSGDVFGTPAYMSPEQVRGQALALDRRTDVYSLGATLYECLTLRRPFEAPTREALFQAILASDPLPPRRLNPRLPLELDIVLETALEKDVVRRYRSAHELAEDLENVRKRQPIRARPVSRWLRARRWVQRHPAIASTLAVLVAGIVAASLLASDSARSAAEARTSLERWTRLADAKRHADLEAEAQGVLWPALPSKIPRMQRWLERARALVARLPEHRHALELLSAAAPPLDEEARAESRRIHRVEWARLEEIELQLKDLATLTRLGEESVTKLTARIDALDEKEDLTPAEERVIEAMLERVRLEEHWISKHAQKRAELLDETERLQRIVAERRVWNFERPEDRFRHLRLSELVSGLRELDGPQVPGRVTIAEMQERLALARRLDEIRRSPETKAAWAAMCDDVARPDSPYAGLSLQAIPGLVPLGVDRDSGLWELWHVASGTRPRWEGAAAGRGRVVLDPRSGAEGLTMVLLRGGATTNGVRPPAPGAELGKPFVDPDADPRSEVHDLTLAPYLISKFEVTQAQWRRATGSNPSTYFSGRDEYEEVTDRNPVTDVSWRECAEDCRRWNLVLPTEAWWEHACRAGTTTIFSTGNDVSSLEGFANIADAASAGRYPSTWTFTPDFADGHAVHAPVGSLLPNRFGLHDMHGNVTEWCRDPFLSYRMRSPRPGDGQRGSIYAAGPRVLRGGSFYTPAGYARSGFRSRNPTDYRSDNLGLRPARGLE